MTIAQITKEADQQTAILVLEPISSFERTADLRSSGGRRARIGRVLAWICGLHRQSGRNYNLRFHDEGVARTDLNHFTVCRNDAVLGMVAEQVTAAIQTIESTSEPVSQVASSRSRYDEWQFPFD